MAAPTPTPKELAQDLGPHLLIFVVVMTVIPPVAVALRFWARALSSENKNMSRFWWDDWVALAALFFFLVCSALVFYLLDQGLGKHIYALTITQLENGSIAIYALYFTYDTSLTLGKCSALLFYHRIFSKTSVKFRYSLWASQFLVFAWWIGIMLGTVFMCRPINKGWLPLGKGHCNDISQLWIGSAVPSVVIDLVILLLPLPMLYWLKMSRVKKVLILGVFICGYSIVVISVGRLVTVLKSKDDLAKDLTYAGIPALYWLSAEPAITILSICLPSIFFLGRRLLQGGPRSLFSSQESFLRNKSLKGYVRTKPSYTSNEGRSMDSSGGVFQGPNSGGYHVQAAKINDSEMELTSTENKGDDINVQYEVRVDNEIV